MSEHAFETRYICFADQNPVPGEDIRGLYVTVMSQRNQLPCRLDPHEFQLASATAQRFNPELNHVDMDRFTHMLTDA